LTARLKHCGAKVLETNVVCFSTPMSADLTACQRRLGRSIFKWLLDRIEPKVLIVHGRGAAKDVMKLNPTMKVIEIPSLAPPAYNKWQSESEAILAKVASEVCEILRCNTNSSGA